MDKPFFRLVGAPCGQHGQYTFYKALRVTGKKERIIAIGDFFFVRIWQDSELVSIGELQLLWTDRVSDQTLVSLRLYFLPENTPDGRNQHGEDEVLAINEKVVVKAEDLMSWVCDGDGWRWGLRAIWRGSCAPPATEPKPTQALHHTKLDFSDVDKEKDTIVDEDSPGVMVFSYPRYCRYRALISRLEGIQADWLRDSLVAALGGYSAPSNNTRILYCKDTFEYPELECHEFVCNELAPRLKGRPRGRRRRAPRSRSRSPSSRSSDSDGDPPTPRRLSLRNGTPGKHSHEEDSAVQRYAKDKAFLAKLQQFYKERGEPFKGYAVKDCSLRWLYSSVVTRGGYGTVCRRRLWPLVNPHSPTLARTRYERLLLQYENEERKKGVIFKFNGVKLDEPQTIATIEVTDSPLREIDPKPAERVVLPEKRLRTPSPSPGKAKTIDNETGEFKEEFSVVTKSAEVLNREFLESLPKDEEKPAKISVKPVEKLLEPKEPAESARVEEAANHSAEVCKPPPVGKDSSSYLADVAHKFNLESRDAPRGPRDPHSVIPAHALTTAAAVAAAAAAGGHAPTGGPAPASGYAPNGYAAPPPLPTEQRAAATARPLGRSSLRAVRVKPTRPHRALPPTTPPAPPAPPPLRPEPAASSPPVAVTNFGIHRPPPVLHHSDDEIIEVPYKPKSPEIIDLDEYEEGDRRNEHSTKKKKLDLLKERGLEVTALPCWTPSHSAGMFHRQLAARAQLLHMFGCPPPPPPPRAAQAACPFGSAGATKTVYCDPRAPLMPAPHVLFGAPPRPAPSLPAHHPMAALPASPLDLTRPPVAAPPKVEITLVNKWKGGNGAVEPYAALYGRLAAYRQLAAQREKR